MISRKRDLARAGAWVALFSLLFLTSCNRAAPPATQPRTPRIVSLSPAATQLMLALGLGEALVGVSNFESSDVDAALPRMGDYQSVDWEKMLAAQPTHVLVQAEPTRLPSGLKDRAAAAGISLVIVRLNRVEDVFSTLDTLAQQFNAPARDVAEGLRERWVSLGTATANFPRVKTLICVSPASDSAAGRETFLDDMVVAAGGVNALEQNGYVSLEAERVLELDPEVIFVFAPGESEQSLQASRDRWARRSELRAVRTQRVHWITRNDALMPGPGCVPLANALRGYLHDLH